LLLARLTPANPPFFDIFGKNKIFLRRQKLRFLLMANGDYGDITWYQQLKDDFDRVIGVDGGTVWAMRMGIVPHRVVGDMDSISPQARDYAASLAAEFTVVPREKDNTDFQLGLELAEEDGAAEIIIWGGTGTRLDHTLSNLFSASSLVLRGIKVCFQSPREDIHLINRRLILSGKVGDTVSLITLGEESRGVTLHGFQYPLTNATLNGRWQHAVSNIITEPQPVVEIGSGVVAVIHYRELP
jgi:thiamine pyrophosphokinase